MTVEPPICYECRHFHDDNPEATKLTCCAYPKGIPLAILLSKVNHQSPVKGDNGIKFESKEPFVAPVPQQPGPEKSRIDPDKNFVHVLTSFRGRNGMEVSFVSWKIKNPR